MRWRQLRHGGTGDCGSFHNITQGLLGGWSDDLSDVREKSGGPMYFNPGVSKMECSCCTFTSVVY